VSVQLEGFVMPKLSVTNTLIATQVSKKAKEPVTRTTEERFETSDNPTIQSELTAPQDHNVWYFDPLTDWQMKCLSGRWLLHDTTYVSENPNLVRKSGSNWPTPTLMDSEYVQNLKMHEDPNGYITLPNGINLWIKDFYLLDNKYLVKGVRCHFEHSDEALHVFDPDTNASLTAIMDLSLGIFTHTLSYNIKNIEKGITYI